MMMSTRRSLTLTVFGVVMLALAGSAAAQLDSSRATTVPASDAVVGTTSTFAADGTVTAGGTVSVEKPTIGGYESLTVKWKVPPGYRSNCTLATTAGDAIQCTGWADTDADRAGPQTPLTGFVVYYSKLSITDVRHREVMEMKTTGGTARTDGMGEYMLEGLEPGTTYYVNVAAENAAGPGMLNMTLESTAKTDAAPEPAVVTGVMVEPGDKMLTVSWDPADPDAKAQRTNLTVTEYHIQYRTSQTTIKTAGDWMPMAPMDPMKTMGDVTTTMIEGLMNDIEYDVQVRAVNSATGKGPYSAQSPRSKGTPTAMTPTPALPLFGAFGLGVGLLAAGRARLRRRAQRQLTR